MVVDLPPAPTVEPAAHVAEAARVDAGVVKAHEALRVDVAHEAKLALRTDVDGV